ncbi:MAG: RNA-binding protein [candidate division KSB1 bacterium]|nr:RNA-binding protein [candidate division KSB1 bacterium]MDZ7335333.1 RNA-binding protein [candidate division KSB1 bacterium]MDZ7356806.1 RNA-binding protein [candidate division KSB1 bacterium]MDZ7399019.1 RNA-binding protein [candidate division KSB1 bacterium]
MRIYVGNLPKDTEEDDLIEMFSEYGSVKNIKIIRDRFSNNSRGYAFLELPDAKAAFEAIRDWDQGSIDDQIIRVDIAKASLKEFESYRQQLRH